MNDRALRDIAVGLGGQVMVIRDKMASILWLHLK